MREQAGRRLGAMACSGRTALGRMALSRMALGRTAFRGWGVPCAGGRRGSGMCHRNPS
jgi:hypothetical protein